MALRKALHCAVDGEDDEGSKHHFPLGLHNENNREHAASGVNSSSLFIRWSAQLRQPFLCAPSSDNGTRLPHHSPNQTERGGHRSISYLSAYGWATRRASIAPSRFSKARPGSPAEQGHATFGTFDEEERERIDMIDQVDLKELSVRESAQVEWKENVADTDDVAETLSAFANDWANLGGGYVVCGAKEEKDEHGFPQVKIVGLSANRVKEVEGRVLAACRDRVSPSIAPMIQELATEHADRRVLVFIMPATRTAHMFRRSDHPAKHYVRISRETREARNGVLRELLVRKGVAEEWDRSACLSATTNDLDLIALRDALQRMGVFNPDRGLDEYISETKSLSPFVPPLCFREPLTGILRPRNFAVLLFGRNVQAHIAGAYALFSVYSGIDRSEPHAERNELPGTLVEQARRLIELLDVQSYVAFDKTDRLAPNAVKYPPQALHEAMINALAHRDYQIVEPTRITVFSDRIEEIGRASCRERV